MPDTDEAVLIDLARGKFPSGLSPDRVDALYELAATHGLLGFVQETLEQHKILLPRWKDFVEQTELATKIQLQAAAEAASAFGANNVDAIFVKGAALAVRIYERPLRPFNDLDVLIRPAQLGAAHRALAGLGYTPNNALRNPIELDYVREKLPGFRICIDLHWDFTAEDGLQAGVRMPLDEILTRKMTVRGIPIPVDEDALLFAAANFARKCAEPLMLIFDVAKLLRRPLDFERVGERAHAWGLKTPLWASALLAQRMLDVEAPADFIGRLAPPAGRARRLMAMLSGAQLWHTDKTASLRYRFLFKLRCVDSWSGLCAVALGMPKGVLRKLGLTQNLAASVLRENAALTSPHRA